MEFPGVVASFSVDPYDFGFVVTNTSGNGLNLANGASFVFSDLQWQGVPRNLIGVDISNNDFAFINATTSFTADSATVSFTANSLMPSGGQMTVALETEIIPEPATMILLGVGSLALLRRRKR